MPGSNGNWYDTASAVPWNLIIAEQRQRHAVRAAATERPTCVKKCGPLVVAPWCHGTDPLLLRDKVLSTKWACALVTILVWWGVAR